jgi:hypothetical protein
MFVKAPKTGRAKTRLAKDIGYARAAGFYRHATTTLTQRLGQDTRWQTVLAVDPPSALAGGWCSVWPLHLPRVSQGHGDLGERIGRMFMDLSPGPVIIIGSDAPQVSTTLIVEAFAKLRGADAVFGPAKDGGYWLIGMKRSYAAPNPFKNVRWSTEHTLKDTLATLPKSYRIAWLPELDDVDEGADLQAQPKILLRSISG